MDDKTTAKPGTPNSGRTLDLRRRLVLGTALATSAFLGGYVRRAYAACAPSGAGTYTCSGATTTTQALNGNPLTVTTDPGFSIDTTGDGGDAFALIGTNGLTFTDNNVSTITGGFSGINAYNYGGAVSITATGAVTGMDGNGIYVSNTGTDNAGTDLTIAAADVSGGLNGIIANNFGTGALSITATGAVTGTNGDGIYALNNGTDLTIAAADVGGATSGLGARNDGTGVLSITATGTVTGTNDEGIFALNYGTDLTIEAADVSGGTFGIAANNAGTGAFSITASGTVTGENGYGIVARNYGTGMTIEAVDIKGGYNGIWAINSGSDAFSITTTGTVTGTSANGIAAANEATGTDLTINAVAVSGGTRGIFANNAGTGTLSITTTGTVEGKLGEGIYALNSDYGAGLTIEAMADVSGADVGISARNSGAGVLSITAKGMVEGGAGRGIYALNDNGSGTDLTIEAVNVSSETDGIFARNDGSGMMSISTSGTVAGGTGYGIYARNTGTGLTISANDVSGGNSGIVGKSYGSGALAITASGTVEGGNTVGILGLNDTAGTDVTISAAAVNSGTIGIAATNAGTGALSISATKTVTGKGGYGIVGINSSSGTDLTISTAAVNGLAAGIAASNQGSGALSIIASDTVAASGYGINARNSGTDLTISTANVSGGAGIDARNDGSGALSISASGEVTGTAAEGIDANNFGTGALSITATGTVTGGTSYDGINAVNNNAGGTDLTISTADVGGGGSGIRANNAGGGTVSVTSTGTVTGTNDDGINANNNFGTDLTIQAVDVNGGINGILATNSGSGAVSITSSGTVTGTSHSGITALNDSTGTDLTVQVVDVSGGYYGIRAENYGSGVLSITATGAVTSTSDDGISASNTSTGADMTIHVADVSGGTRGIYAQNVGNGALSITASGVVTGAGGDGISAVNGTYTGNTGTDLKIDATAVNGGGNGIFASNFGSGALEITATGPVAGTNGAGIFVANDTGSNATDLTIMAADVSGGTDGIFAGNDGSGSLTVTTSGTVEGGSGKGIYALNNGADLMIEVADVSGATNGIEARNYGSGALEITTSGTINGGSGNAAIGIAATNNSASTDSTTTVTVGDGSAVSGGAFGVALASTTGRAATLENAGSIAGATGILGNGGASTIANTGTITGTGGAAIDLIAAGGPSTVNQQDGTISGDLQLSANGDTVNITGGAIEGHIYGQDSADLNFDLGDKTFTFDAPYNIIDMADITMKSGTVGIAGAVEGDSLAVNDGTLLLSGDAGFSNGTIVSGGKLLVGDAEGNGTLSGTIHVEEGGTLGGSGTIFDTVTVDGTLSAGNSPGTLTIDNDLTLGSTSTSVFELNTPDVIGGTGPTGNDLVAVSGTLSLAGTLEARVAAAGYYTLFTYGDLSGRFDSEIIASTSTGFTADSYEVLYGDRPGQVDLSVLAVDQSMQFWDGAGTVADGTIDGGSGIWTAGNTNWTSQSGNTNGTWGGSVGIFAGSAGGTVTVAGTQSFDTLQFSTDGYVLEGDALALGAANGGTLNVDTGVSATIASVIGDGAGTELRKVGNGTLVLSGENTFTGDTTIGGGRLSVAADHNLGDASGNLILDGGMLAVTSGFDTARDVMLEGNGGFDVAQGSLLGVSGTVSGGGDLIKSGDGALQLTGSNSYGNTLVVAGSLIGDAGSISGDIGNAGTVIFDQTADASFAGDIVGLDGTNGVVNKYGAGLLTLEGTSSLDWTITEGGISTEAARFGGDVNLDGTDTALIFNDTEDTVYAGVLSGDGRLNYAGSAITLLTGDSFGFAGTTTVLGGTLLVGDEDGNGALGGSLDILDGGVLGGGGTVGTTTIASGGTIAPGSSIGTLTVEGDITFASGSTYVAEINPEIESDLIDASGKATINGGTVYALKAGGVYTPGSRWTIVGADGGVTGEFDALDQNMPFVNLALAYDADHVYIDATRNEVAFCDVARTFNQCSTGDGLETTGAGNPVYDAVAALPDEDSARAALDSLSGEIYASTKSALIEDSHFVRDAVNDRIRSAFGDATGTDMSVMAYGEDGPRLTAPDSIGPVAWGYAFGAWGSFDSDGNAATMDTSTGGFLTGIDGEIASDIRLGLLAGYSHSSFDVDDRASSGSSDNYHLGLYAGGRWDALRLSGGLAYTWHDIGTGRSVAFQGFSDSLTGDHDAGTFQAFGEAGYRIGMGAVSFEPFANLAYVNLHTDGFTEKGGDAALHVQGETTETTFTTLGLHLSSTFTIGGVKAIAHGTLGWRHAFGDKMPLSTHAFAGGDPFTIAGVPIAEDAASIGVGLDLDFTEAATLGLAYQGQFGDGVTQNGFKADLTVRF